MTRRLLDRGLVAEIWLRLKAREAQPATAGAERPENWGRDPLGLQVRDAGDDPAEMLIYDEIGYWGVTAQRVADALGQISGPIHVRINSPGGDVFDGVAIYNLFADHDGDVKVTVDGLAASAASFIAMAGDTIMVNRASMLMIHDASSYCYGNAADMEGAAALLNRVSDTIAGIYADRAGGDTDEWRNVMRAETWYDGAEAIAAGLADTMAPSRETDPDTDPEEPPAARAATAWNLSVFRFAGRSQAPRPPRIGAGPTAVHHTATDDSEWDGPGAVANMPAEAATLKACHAWVDDDGDADAKGSYKFPHHKTKGGPANLAACRNGLARLSSADIPEADQAGVKAHLQAHLDDAADDDPDDVADLDGQDPGEEPAEDPAADPADVDDLDDDDGEEEPAETPAATDDQPLTLGDDTDAPLTLGDATDDWAATVARLTDPPQGEDALVLGGTP